MDLTSSTRPNQGREALRAVAYAAEVVLNHMLGDRRSVIDPACEIWTAASAERMRSAIEDTPDTGTRPFFDKLQEQLAEAPREVVLLAAEAIYLRGVPLSNISPAKKREHVQTVLCWLREVPSIPEAMERGMHSGGSFNGGIGFNHQIWQQVPWIARFAVRWLALSQDQRKEAQRDPWVFRAVVLDDSNDLPAMRNAFLFMAFPAVFESVVNDDHKLQIRDAFALLIGGATGAAREAIDRDLLAIRARLEEGLEAHGISGRGRGSRRPATRSIRSR